ncbi:hypothetical protein D3C87_830780 [compost metagenome]
MVSEDTNHCCLVNTSTLLGITKFYLKEKSSLNAICAIKLDFSCIYLSSKTVFLKSFEMASVMAIISSGSLVLFITTLWHWLR